MRSQFLAAAIALCVIVLMGTARAGDEPVLKPGSPAPKLMVSKWVKGEPVKEIENGKVYVLECWATWCGPCRQAIPHVTELQKKYKDAIFIGMNVWEPDQSKVEPFVKEMGEKMEYRVAMDDLSDGEGKGKMAVNWLMAAGRNGIPCSFIVGKDAKIAWIGHPLQMELILAAVVKGTFDAAKQAEMDAKREAMGKDLNDAFKKEDWDKALALLVEFAKQPGIPAARVGMSRFHILLDKKKDCDAAFALAAKLGDEFKDDSMLLNDFAWAILDTAGLPKRDLDLALKLATRADEVAKHADAAILDTLGRAYFEKGDVDKAIATQQKAVEAAGDNGKLKDSLAEALKKYQDKKAGK